MINPITFINSALKDAEDKAMNKEKYELPKDLKLYVLYRPGKPDDMYFDMRNYLVQPNYYQGWDCVPKNEEKGPTCSFGTLEEAIYWVTTLEGK